MNVSKRVIKMVEKETASPIPRTSTLKFSIHDSSAPCPSDSIHHSADDAREHFTGQKGPCQFRGLFPEAMLAWMPAWRVKPFVPFRKGPELGSKTATHCQPGNKPCNI